MSLWQGLLAIVITTLSAPAQVIRFDGATVGTVPSGWFVAMTHTGGPPQWQIVRDPGAPSPPLVLAQTSRDRTAGRFPIAIWNGASIRDGVVSVAFKPISGSVDQAAGIVWQYQDADNYYIVRANALENNIVLYKVTNGVRLSIAPTGLPSRSYGVVHQVARNVWSRLRVVFKSGDFSVFFNEEHVFDAQDATFTKAGRTGLWTKADSVTYFDDFSVSGK
jgi:hypothetical protein